MPDQNTPVGQAAYMPGTEGFTMACFKATDVPAGTNLYTLPAIDEDADIYLINRVWEQFRKDACVPGDDRVSEAFIKVARILMGATANAELLDLVRTANSSIRGTHTIAWQTRARSAIATGAKP